MTSSAIEPGNTYALTICPDAPNRARSALIEVLKTDERVTGWWNHLPNLYLLTSDRTAAVISDMVEPAIKPWSFLVIRVDPADAQGWLPERAWPWIQRLYA
jgi:hypothetical protein